MDPRKRSNARHVLSPASPPRLQPGRTLARSPRGATPLLVTALLAAACDGAPGDGATVEAAVSQGSSSPVATAAARALSLPPGPGDEEAPLEMRLRSAEGAADAPRDDVAVLEGEPLSPARVRELLSRLPPLESAPQDEVEVALPEETLPPPRPGRTIETTFPPEQPAAGDAPGGDASSAELEVLRVSPEGEVPIAPRVSVTFSQPMVALATRDELARREPPLRLEPRPAGRWEWLGTRTVVFEPEGGRLPMATRYEVTVPAGTRSASGARLERSQRFEVVTPPPGLVGQHPTGGSQPLRPVVVLSFDQRVDPGSVLEALSLEAGGVEQPLRLATEEEISSDDRASRLVERALEGRAVAVVPEEPLPAGTRIEVVVAKGLASAEGPRRTQQAQSFDFETHGPLEVVRVRCGWGDECRPGWPWRVETSNAIDAELFEKSMVRVSPERRGFDAEPHGDAIAIEGTSEAETTYEVTIAAGLTDVFGQRLGRDVTRTVRVGPARPHLSGPDRPLVVLEPAARTELPVHSVGFDSLLVAVHDVEPADWEELRRHFRERRPDSRPPLPGRRVLSRVVEVEGPANELVETRIDLSGAMRGGLGHAVVSVMPARPRAASRRPPEVTTWVQSTRIGLDALVDDDELVAWASDLADGSPLPNVELALLPDGARARTDSSGLARLALPASTLDRSRVLVARRGDDVAFLPEDLSWWGGSHWHRREDGERVLWHVQDDRGLYRPGETARVKGWLRRLTPGAGSGLSLPAGETSVEWTLTDAQGNEVAKGREELTALGGFDLEVSLPEEMNLGGAALVLGTSPGEARHHHALRVQEFRRPEFEVSVTVSEGPHVVGASARLEARAAYLAGGGLGGAPVRWTARATPASYRPPGWDRYRFGRWIPWWLPQPVSGGRSAGIGAILPAGPASDPVVLEATTDARGRHAAVLDLVNAEPPLPSRVEVEATVTDVNRQAWTGATGLLVHPGRACVGLRTDRAVVEGDRPLDVELIVVDPDGAVLTGRDVQVEAARLDWKLVKGEWSQTREDVRSCRVSSEAEPVTCTFELDVPGRWQVRAVVSDAEGRPSLSEITAWVPGGQSPPQRGVEAEEVRLVPDREEYRPGEVARLLVQAPFHPAEGLLAVQRDGLVDLRRFTMDGASRVVEVRVPAGAWPNAHVVVELVGRQRRTDDRGRADEALPPRPAFALGHVELEVPPLSRTLAVSATPRDRVLPPGGETTIDVEARGADGRPAAGAEALVFVVDEAVLALAGYELADPLQSFYPRRPREVRAHHSRAWLLLDDPEAVRDRASAGGEILEESAGGLRRMAASPMAATAMEDAASGGAQPIALRSDFDPLALWAPAVVLDASGRASVNVVLPDDLTRYRVLAVAVDGADRFGTAESTLTARLPLQARPSPPRFLNTGDRFELPVVVLNQSGEDRDVEVAVRASNLELAGPAGRRVRVPSGDRVEVRLAAVTVVPGTARLQVAAVSADLADAAEVSLPVWTPATTEAFATYGEIDEGAVAQPVTVPEDALPQVGGLEITTSSTALQGLTDAVLYLVSYPFDCSEQLASRVLAVAALRDVLEAFEAEGLPAPEEIERAVRRDLEELARRQRSDGGWGFWGGREEASPFATLHVAHALERAREKGFDVPEPARRRALRWLGRIEQHLEPAWSDAVRRNLVAYALYVRERAGEADPKRARELVEEAGGVASLPVEAIAWILPTLSASRGSAQLVEQAWRHLGNSVHETAAVAHVTTRYQEEEQHVLLHSERRDDALVLEALVRLRPDDDLPPKLVRGLLAGRRAGRWQSTQENAWVLLALDAYFRVKEGVEPDFVARAWLGETLALVSESRGRSTDRQRVEIPMRRLAEGPREVDVTISKDGPGRLYWRLGLRHAPRDLTLAPAEHGFTVERRYEAVDEPGDVRRDADGTWRIAAGARVRVRVSMVAPAVRHHVALVDPLPAGLEPLVPELATTETLPPDPDDDGRQPPPWGWWHWWRWHDHENLRDERAEAFATRLRPGAHSYSYVARATTPGEFVVPPAKAEEMYFPETFGRSGTDRVVVE